MSMAELDLDAIQARADAATEGPWDLHASSIFMNSTGTFRFGDRYKPKVFEATMRNTDADFIAAARQDVPLLVAEVRRLRKIVERQNLTGGFFW